MSVGQGTADLWRSATNRDVLLGQAVLPRTLKQYYPYSKLLLAAHLESWLRFPCVEAKHPPPPGSRGVDRLCSPQGCREDPDKEPLKSPLGCLWIMAVFPLPSICHIHVHFQGACSRWITRDVPKDPGNIRPESQRIDAKQRQRERGRERQRKRTKALQAEGQAGRTAWRCAAKALSVASGEVRQVNWADAAPVHTETRKLFPSEAMQKNLCQEQPMQKRHGSLPDPGLQRSKR